jgi:hypothetical protein
LLVSSFYTSSFNAASSSKNCFKKKEGQRGKI